MGLNKRISFCFRIWINVKSEFFFFLLFFLEDVDNVKEIVVDRWIIV